jgi:predicted small secreted protein
MATSPPLDPAGRPRRTAADPPRVLSTHPASDPAGTGVGKDVWRLGKDVWRLGKDVWRLGKDVWRLGKDVWRLGKDVWRLGKDV